MNQKILRYFLFAALAVIWAAVIYRVIKGLAGDDKKIQETFKASKFDYNIPQDSFIITADYPDPFIPNADLMASENDTLQTVSANNTVKIEKVPIPEVNVQFLGMISNPEKKKKVAIISVSGKEYLAAEKEKVDGVFISEITKEKIIIFVDGKSRRIARQNN